MKHFNFQSFPNKISGLTLSVWLCKILGGTSDWLIELKKEINYFSDQEIMYLNFLNEILLLTHE